MSVARLTLVVSTPEAAECVFGQRPVPDRADRVARSIRWITAADERTARQRRVSGAPVREHLRNRDLASLDVVVAPGKAAFSRSCQHGVDLLVDHAADASVVQRKAPIDTLHAVLNR